MRLLIRRWRWRFLLDVAFVVGVSHTLITGHLVPAVVQDLLRGEPAAIAIVEDIDGAVPGEPDLPVEAADLEEEPPA
jgi:hypothetical protein